MIGLGCFRYLDCSCGWNGSFDRIGGVKEREERGSGGCGVDDIEVVNGKGESGGRLEYVSVWLKGIARLDGAAM